MQRAILCGLILLCACGEKSKVAPAPGNSETDAGPYGNDGGDGGKSTAGRSGSGGRGGAAGGAGSGGAAGTDADAGMDMLAPVITFIAPKAVTEPSSEDVVTTTSLAVRCNVVPSEEPGAAAVDKSAVKIDLERRDSAGVVTTSGAVSAITDSEFEATFDLSSLPNGAVTFRCTGKDLGGHSGSTTLTTLVDLGPTITLKKPLDKGIYALKTPMAIEFEVKPAPLGDDDDKAKVVDVALSVAGLDIKVTESTTTPGLYQANIDFSNKMDFPVAPTAAQLQYSATNARTPNAPTRIVRADVTIDGAGPSIVVNRPAYASIQRGVVELVITVKDPSDIMPGTLIATINTVPYSTWTGVAPEFKQTFDTNMLDPTHELTQLTINITAIDKVGNKTDPPVAHLFRLDNVPPVVSLNPPTIVESRVVPPSNNVYCSQPFDPLGPDAANDLQNVLASQLFRVLVEDRTNRSPGATYLYHSGVKTSSVEMYTQGLPDVPLLIDTDGDTYCDAINKSDDMNIRDADRVSPEEDPVKLALTAVNPTGTSWFAKPSTPDTDNNPSCPNDPAGTDSPPTKFCPNTDMLRVIPGRTEDKPPAVYAHTPSNSQTGACNGSDWNIKGNTRGRDGWICVAARASDNIGNVGVSEPLRLCFDDGVAPPPDCSGPPPSCAKNCTIGAGQKFVSEAWPYQ
jgi:hypothetical protein